MHRFFLGCCLLLAQLVAHAQALPQTIKIIHPFAAGGGVDGRARMVEEALLKSTQSTVIVEAKPGAGGIIATAAVTDAKPDGSIL